MRINYACTCFQGMVRQNNEDNFWCAGKYLPCVNKGTDDVFTEEGTTAQSPAFAIFDGMGGEQCGEMASFLASERFDQLQGQWRSVPEMEAETFIQILCQDLNDRVYEYARENDIGIMGSTAAMMFFRERNIYAANVGDSRIYRFYNHKLDQVSKDHTCFSPVHRRKYLTQFLGIPKEETVLSPCIQKMDICAGEEYLLCSDGLTEMFTDQELEKIVCEETSVENTVMFLQEETLRRGAWDNTTIILCKIQD